MRVAAPLALLFVIFVAAMPVQAQPAEAPAVAAAEGAFDEGLRYYRAGQYERAYDAFIDAATDYGYNQRTTAAYLMAGKALYAAGRFEEAASVMTTFLGTYGRSRYADEARRVRRRATDRLNEGPASVDAFDLGLALPMDPGNFVFTQALFNGVRLAVEAYNEAHPEAPVRMVFRDTGGTPVGAERALEQLGQAGVELAIGPLYSEEAAAAGAAAERARVTLVAPLATDEHVTDGRRYVFQANPSFTMRGRFMGRYAAATMDGPFGVVVEAGSFGEIMGTAFREAVEEAGGTVAYTERLAGSGSWFRLPEILDPLHLAEAEAVYLPVTGRDAPRHAAGALRGFGQLFAEEAEVPAVLGNAEWYHLRDGARADAERFAAVFTQDFFVDERAPAVRDFARRYRALASVEPDRLAYAGYDVAGMLLAALAERRSEEPLPDLLHRARPYAGLGHRIDFGGSNVNAALFLLGFRDGAVVVVE